MLDPQRLRSLLSRLSPAEREEVVRGFALLAREGPKEMRSLSTNKFFARRSQRQRSM